jgi:hypothetical protein
VVVGAAAACVLAATPCVSAPVCVCAAPCVLVCVGVLEGVTVGRGRFGECVLSPCGAATDNSCVFASNVSGCMRVGCCVCAADDDDDECEPLFTECVFVRAAGADVGAAVSVGVCAGVFACCCCCCCCCACAAAAAAACLFCVL